MLVRWFSLRLAIQHVRADLSRSVLSVLAVALGVSLVVAIQAMTGAVLQSFLDTISGLSGRADLSVTAAPGETFPELLAQSLPLEGVKAAVPILTTTTFAATGTEELLVIHAIDLADRDHVRLYYEGDLPKDIDELEFLSQPTSVILTKEFAARNQLTVGSGIELMTPNGRKTFTVRGVIEPQGLARTLGGRLVIMDLAAAQKMFATDGRISQVDVFVEKDQETEVEQRLRKHLPPGLQVATSEARSQVVRTLASGMQAMLALGSLLAVATSAVICYTRLTALLEKRAWEIGLMRAVGLRRSTVFVELIKESVVMGFLGSVLGIPLGIAIGTYALPIMARMHSLHLRSPVQAEALSIGWSAPLLGLAIGILSSILAALIPVIRMAWRSPIAVLRSRGRELDPLSNDRRSDVILVVAVVTIVAAVVYLRMVTQSVGLGNAAVLVIAVSLAALAVPMVSVASALLRKVGESLVDGPTRFALTRIGEQRRNTTLTVATVGLGLGIVLLLRTLGSSLEGTMVSQLSARFPAGTLIVSSPFAGDGYVPLPIGDETERDIRAVPGVLAVGGWFERIMNLSDHLVVLSACDSNLLLDPRLQKWNLRAGSHPDAVARTARGEAAMVSGAFADQFGMRPGSRLTLPSPAGNVVLEIVGTLDIFPFPMIVIDRSIYREYWGGDDLTWVVAGIDSQADFAGVSAAIVRETSKNNRVIVRTADDFSGYFAEQVRVGFRAANVMVWVVLAVVIVGVGDTLATSVLERMREFGLLRAVGVRRSRVFWVVVLESGVLGCLGVLLGVLIAGVLGVFCVQVQYPALVGWAPTLHFPILFTFAAGAMMIAICLGAGAAPGARAAYLQVSEALRAD